MNSNINELVNAMTLEEKASLCSGLNFWRLKGIERLGIPSIMVADGPHGLRKQAEGNDHLGIYGSVKSTCFPTASAVASSWDRSLIEKMGIALGEECQAEDVSILLGPGTNIKRSPLCGRNFEYFSEDPYLSSEMSTSHIKGVQSQGIGTSLKHFAVNNQEHRRMSTDAIVAERTLREIYLASFEGAVKQGEPWTVMAAYNKVNGEFASENSYLLNDILKEEWGFGGAVISDWGAVNERVPSLMNGLDLEMPPSGTIGDEKIIEAVKNGEISKETLDRAVERILFLILKAQNSKKEDSTYEIENHHLLAREIASESMVLLKNDESILPLKRDRKLAVIGSFARNPRYQGGGSSHINPTKLDSMLEQIEITAGKNTNVVYADGYNLENDLVDQDLINEAVEVVKDAGTVVIFVGLPDRYESEGYDREHLRIPDNHIQLIEAIEQVNKNIVVVLSNGAPIEMPWLHKVKGLLEAYLGGQAVGGAIADVLFGKVNPSGKLAETFPKKLSDNPSFLYFPGEEDKVEYKEGIFVGYRYYDKKEIEPLFPFGYGLSYTTFEYSKLTVSKKELKDTETVTVSVRIKNTGSVAGKEIIQLYVRDVESTVNRPMKELKGFEKVELQPGEEKTVYFELSKRAFAYYNESIQGWHVESGEFEILVGKSSKEIVLKETLYVQTTEVIPNRVHRNTLIGDLFSNPILAPVAQQLLEKLNEGNPSANASADAVSPEMMAAMMKYMPLRALLNFSQGALTEEMLSGIIYQLNEQLDHSTLKTV